jgi:hypothetical protein
VGIEHARHSRRWSNREKAAAAIVKSVSISCADRVVDERARAIQTVLIARFRNVHSPHDKNKVRTCMAVSREFSGGACGLSFRAYKRMSMNSPESRAKELAAGQSDRGLE